MVLGYDTIYNYYYYWLFKYYVHFEDIVNYKRYIKLYAYEIMESFAICIYIYRYLTAQLKRQLFTKPQYSRQKYTKHQQNQLLRVGLPPSKFVLEQIPRKNLHHAKQQSQLP